MQVVNYRLSRALQGARHAGLRILRGVPSEGVVADPQTAVWLPDLVTLLYPDVEEKESLIKQSREVLGKDSVTTSSELRHLLANFDRQAFPSPVSVRFRPEDIRTLRLKDFSIALDRHDPSVSAIIADRLEYEPHVAAIMRRYVKPGMTVLDIGANIGFHAMLFSSLVGPSGRVIAFEPNSENCRLILATADGNHVTNIELRPVALDTDTGWTYFTSHLGSNGGILRKGSVQYVEGGGFIVPCFPLDKLVDSPVDFIKIDVEGAEGRVIAGGLETISRYRPVVISEFSVEMLKRVSELDAIEYLTWFAELDYSLNIVESDEPSRLMPFSSPQELLASWGSDELRVADLLFLPKKDGSSA